MTKNICAIPLISVLAFMTACSSSDDIVTASIKGGDFQLLEVEEGDHPYPNLTGYAQLIITNETSEVDVYVDGLEEGKDYSAHVHTAWCASGGGGHYLQDGDTENDVAENGLWPKVTVGDDGIGTGNARNKFIVTDDAKSVVIHDYEGGTRIGCVDLVSSHGLSGTFSITEAGKDLYEAIEGQAFVSVTQAGGGWSKAEVAVTGLTAATDEQVEDEELPTYKTHVHVGDCASGGGGHYTYDPDEDANTASNELWPKITVSASGYGSGWDRQGFDALLEETKSIVVHDAEDSSIRVACADLTTELLAFRSGSFALARDGENLTPNLKGRAKLSISVAGETTASLFVSGLEPDDDYMSHVHNASCDTNDGGGHYLQNMSGVDDKSNGIYLPFTPSADGTAMVEVSKRFIVRPDARSVVVHNPDGARIACADLK